MSRRDKRRVGALLPACALALLALIPATAAAKPGDVLVTDYDAFGDDRGGIFRIDPATGARTGVAAGDPFSELRGIVFAGGQILVSDEASGLGNDGAVYRVDPSNGSKSLVADGPPFAERAERDRRRAQRAAAGRRRRRRRPCDRSRHPRESRQRGTGRPRH